MQKWMAEADVYRLSKAYEAADPIGRERIAPHLRRATEQLRALGGNLPGGGFGLRLGL